jgi:glycosyltransferase involved in cell wall biosynthesis
MPNLSIILPARDEARALADLLPEIRRTMDELGEPYEAIVVDDGSRDGTGRFLEELSRDWPELVGIQLRRTSANRRAPSEIDRAKGKSSSRSTGGGTIEGYPLLEKLGETTTSWPVGGWTVRFWFLQETPFTPRQPIDPVDDGNRASRSGLRLESFPVGTA